MQPPALLHLGKALGRLQGADQHGVGDADAFADEIQAPVQPVGAIHIGVAGRPEHGRIALGPAAIAVRRRVLVVVSLDLDDASAHAVDEQRRPDQFGRDRVDAAGKKVTAKLAHAATLASRRR